MAAPPSASNVRVPITRPQLGKTEADAVARVVRSRWVIQGPEVAAFENELAAAVGSSHAVAVSSGTAALELALRVLGVGPGHEVITVSHSFIATANCIMAVGARPVFVDVERDNFGMNAALVAEAVSPQTKAILAVHQLGFPCDLGAILDIGRKHGIPVVEDAACALGSELSIDGRWERIGRPHGVMACFSFHPRKVDHHRRRRHDHHPRRRPGLAPAPAAPARHVGVHDRSREAIRWRARATSSRPTTTA